MKLDEVFKKGQSYPENFFYGDMLEVIKAYDLPEGTFLLGKTGEEIELFWGVEKFDDFKEGIEKIKIDNKDSKFIFRYANNLNTVFERKKIIGEWGYEEKDLHVGYQGLLNTFSLNLNCPYIQRLNPDDIHEFFSLERKVFQSFNISEKELKEWINSEDYIILIYKENQKIKGFVIIHVYGENKQNCFVRDLGVSLEERKKGIGKKLILTGLKEAKKKGALKTMLWVNYNNIIARNLYERIGYKMNEDEAEIVFKV